MIDKLRRAMIPKSGTSQKSSLKNWVAYVLFGAIILVFALFGLNPNEFGDASAGGVAAVVNHNAISLNEYRSRVENLEQNARMRFDQFPEAQRKALTAQMRRRALDELILGEVVYQEADNRGIVASDAEVRDYILQIPFLQENGRFMKDRYRAFLTNMNLRTDDFERQVRKQIVTQKLQELFVGAATPTREELNRTRLLANQKVNVRFAEVSKAELSKLVSDSDVQAFLATNKPAVEKYYNDNKVEYSSPEKIKARHILVRLGDTHKDDEALKIITDAAKQATPANFAQLAAKISEDPGSKSKGGDLGEFDRGRMVPAFEEAAFALNPGQISKPVKTDFGYHLILVESKKPATTAPLASVEKDIARQLLLQSKESDVIAGLRKQVESGNKREIDGLVARSGARWQESGEFDLSTSNIPKLGESPALITELLKHGKNPGLIPQLVSTPRGYLVAEVISWKETADNNPDVEGVDRMVAYRKSSDLIEGWSKEAEANATIERNPRLLQQ